MRCGRLGLQPFRGTRPTAPGGLVEGVVSTKRPTAYLMGCLDITQTPPTMIGVALMSTNQPACFLNEQIWVELSRGYGVDYEDGLDHLREQYAQRNHLQWTVPLLSEEDRADMGVS